MKKARTCEVKVLDEKRSIANQFLAELRDKDGQTDRMRFRKNLERLGEIMAYEVSKELAYTPSVVETPLGMKSIDVLAEKPVIICVLRAALPYFQGFFNVFDDSDCGFVGAYRKEGHEAIGEVEVEYLYQAVPTLSGRVVIIVDPMLATGKSFVKVVGSLFARETPSRLHLCSAIAAPEGIDYLKSRMDISFDLWVGSVDDRLDESSFIVPGLGDAGDLSFGNKV